MITVNKINQIKKQLNITLFFLILLYNIPNCNSFHNEKKNVITHKNDPIEKYSLYQKCNKNYCNFIKKFSRDGILTKDNKKYLLTDQYSLSEIQINNNFLNFKTIHLKNYDQLIFHQLSYQFINKKKICNFGVGYRKHYCTQWTIGNNIFYDVLLSSSEDDKKILSIGTEFLKNFMHITINTYYNISNNNPFFIDKKYLPISYDIYIKNRLPYFTNTHTKINMEYFFNKKHKNTNMFLQKINTIQQYPFNKNAYKLTLGLICIPTSIFTFNIDKTIISSPIKNHETKFNIVANYKIYIPWITSQNEKKINDNQYHINNYEKTEIINNNEHTIYRNYTTVYPSNINIKNTEIKNNIQQYKEHKKTKEYEQKKIQHSIKDNHEFHDSNKKDNIIPNTTTISHNIKKESSNNNDQTASVDTKSPICSELNEQVDNSALFVQRSNSQTTEILEIQQKKSQKIDIAPNNIPIPPPIKFEIFSNDNVHSKKDTSPKSYINNDSNYSNNLKNNIIVTKKHKSDKFSSLGSEEHLLKLSNITKKRKKTISTSSNDSNDSESIRLLKIIERQSILTKNSDTDSEDKDSMLTDNDFSE